MKLIVTAGDSRRRHSQPSWSVCAVSKIDERGRLQVIVADMQRRTPAKTCSRVLQQGPFALQLPQLSADDVTRSVIYPAPRTFRFRAQRTSSPLMFSAAQVVRFIARIVGGPRYGVPKLRPTNRIYGSGVLIRRTGRRKYRRGVVCHRFVTYCGVTVKRPVVAAGQLLVPFKVE
jgi:hypothetical protein